MPLFTLDPTEPVQTRDGRQARVTAIRRHHIVAEVLGANYDHPKAWRTLTYYRDGHYDPKGWMDGLDLVNVPRLVRGPKRLANRMFPWHDAMGSGMYACASHWVGGHAVPRTEVERATAEAEASIPEADNARDRRSITSIRDALRALLSEHPA